ncbi:LysR family transcriptional regulator [Vibrio sinaloensis]|uniref:LysR family transcriptional regulator n=1 Tax=Photobacterium sp. (strain ATCC 43367) TaxID=379097 RepID=UPI002A696A03|nr:LysR family transcriptional regulator [Vibrio sinaloensis]
MINQIEQVWLASFHCVFQNRSFKLAAEQMNLPSSNVSRHIALLEEKLNTKLFERTTRRVSPTQAGEQLYHSTHSLLNQLNQALEEMSELTQTLSGELRIVMPDSPILANALVSFCNNNPAISLSCETSLNAKQEWLEQFDVVLSFQRGKLTDSTWVANEIARWPSVVVATPKLLATATPPTCLADLNRVPCITSLTALNGTPWVFQHPDGHFISQRVQSTFKVNSGYLAKSAAMASIGFAILPRSMCEQELAQDVLRVVELEHPPADLVLYAFHAAKTHLPRKVALLVEHLKHCAEALS